MPPLLMAAFGLLAAVLAGAGCQTRGPAFDPYGTNTIASATNLLVTAVVTNQLPADPTPGSDIFRLGPGDRLDIELLGEGDGPASTFVGPDGKIYFHLLPGVPVWGLTLEETRALLERELTRYLRQPRVALTLRGVESRRVWVMGRVVTPGIYPLEGPVTVLEAISRAGGLFTSRFSGTTEELADLHHSFIVRRGQYLPVNFHQLIREGDTSQNIRLEPDDFLYLPSSLSTEVFVLGAVGQPRAVGFKDQVTLVSAIAAARGTLPDAHLRAITVVRGSLSKPSVALVDYAAIVSGRQPDVRLQPRDLVFVPYRPLRKLENYVQLAVNTFVRTVAANEGGRAADPNYRGPGVAIPINP